MNEPRPYASLSSGLLARKGAAKPAMRPQGYTGFEDLGWNDMGHAHAPHSNDHDDRPEHVPSSIAALTPLPRSGAGGAGESAQEDSFGVEGDFGHAGALANEDDSASVAAQQRAIADRLEARAEAVPIRAPRAMAAEVVPLPKRGKPLAAGRKAAFTLRLDAERHLRLRLACALDGRSAQQIVTDALDALLAGHPEIESLAASVPAKAGANGTKRN